MSEKTHCCENESSKLPTCCPVSDKKKPWYQTGLFLIACLTSILLSASLLFPKLRPFYDSFMHYAHMVFVPVAIGFLLGGLIDHFVAEEYISKHLAVPRKRTILYSVGLGFLMSACCHGVLAISMEVHKKGASGPAVVSFL